MKLNKTFALGATLLIAGACVFGVSATSSAHNFVVSTTPEDGATLTTLPDRFGITTNDALLDVTGNANAFVFDVVDSDGLFYGDGCVTVDGATMMTDAAVGTAGEYTIAYQLVSADGHSVSGELAFTWDPAPGEPISFGWDTPPVCGEERAPDPGKFPDIAATPEPNDSSSAVPDDSSQGAIADEILWIGGAIAAVVAAGILAMLVLRRRR